MPIHLMRSCVYESTNKNENQNKAQRLPGPKKRDRPLQKQRRQQIQQQRQQRAQQAAPLPSQKQNKGNTKCKEPARRRRYEIICRAWSCRWALGLLAAGCVLL